jgi:hypothetical protein
MKKVNSIYSAKTDVEVIEIYKNNSHWRTKQDIETHLYKKYTPLCKKYSSKYSYLQPMEDNMQDCYFQMIQALDYVDLNKVNDLERYSFGSTFSNYLSSHFIAEYRKYIKGKDSITEEYVTQQEEGLNKIEQGQTESPEGSIIFNMYRDKFEETLPEKEKRLFQLLADGMKKSDIVVELGEKRMANLSYWIVKLQKRYVEFNNSIGYEFTV